VRSRSRLVGNLPRVEELAPDGWIVAFAIGAAALTTLLCTVLPARRAMSRGLSDVARTGTGSVASQVRGHTFERLVVVELALAFAIVLVVGLLGNSYVRLTSVDPGFDPRGLETVSLLPAGQRFRTQMDRLQYFEAVAAQMKTVAGVQGVAYANTLPLARPSSGALYVREHETSAAAPEVDTYFVSANYLEVMSIGLGGASPLPTTQAGRPSR
jgi:hypothetical protein